MKSHVISHPCRLKPAQFLRLLGLPQAAHRRRRLEARTPRRPHHRSLPGLAASPPLPPPVSAAAAGAGATAAAAGLQRRGRGGAGHGPNAPLPRQRCNNIRWDACTVEWDGMGSGGLCVTAGLRIKCAISSGRRPGGRAGRALACGWVGHGERVVVGGESHCESGFASVIWKCKLGTACEVPRRCK